MHVADDAMDFQGVATSLRHDANVHRRTWVIDAREAVLGMRPECWMTQLGDRIGWCALHQLAMVGSHDAATYNIYRTSPGEYAPDAPANVVALTASLQGLAHRITADWAKTQHLTVLQQLRRGARYFDIRLSSRTGPTDLWVTHGLYSVPLERVVCDIAEFYGVAPRSGHSTSDPADAMPSLPLPMNREVIVLDVQRINAKYDATQHPPDPASTCPTDKREMHEAFWQLLRPLHALVANRPDAIRCGLGALWAAGHRIVVLYPKGFIELSPGLLRSGVLPRTDEHIESVWHNVCDVATLRGDVHRELERSRTDVALHVLAPKTDAAGRVNLPLHITQAVMTPKTSEILWALTPLARAPATIEDLAKAANSAMLEVWARHRPIEVFHTPQLPGVPDGRVFIDGRNVLMLDYIDMGTYEGLTACELCCWINARRFGASYRRDPYAEHTLDAPAVVSPAEGAEWTVVN